MIDVDARIRRGVVEYADATPVPDPPPFSSSAAAPPAPGLRRRWLAPAPAAVAVAVTAVLLLAGTVPLPGPRPAGTGAAQAPTLPTELADYSALTGTVTDAPPGRAIALYSLEYEPIFLPSQVVVLAADADRYRYLEQAQTKGFFLHAERSPALLSGDGARVAVGSGSSAVSEIPVVDLRSGEVTRFPVEADSTVTLLAWSADGRWLAYGVRPFQELPEFYGESMRARGGRLMVLDVTTGAAQPVAGPDIPDSVAQAAFSPDGSLLAVQAGGPGESEVQPAPPGAKVVLVGAWSSRTPAVESVPVPADYELAGQASFAPDGSRLALTPAHRPERSGSGWLRTIERRDGAWVSGPDGAASISDGFLLGWQSASRIVLWSSSEIESVNIDGSSAATLARVPGSAEVNVTNLQLAYALLPDLASRPAGEADRGPWPPWLRTITAGVVVAVLGIAALVVWSIRRRRRGQTRRTESTA